MTKDKSQTLFPTRCQHCNKHVSNPPMWLRILDDLAPGSGHTEQAYTIPQIRELTGVSATRSWKIVQEMLKAGAIEKLPGPNRVYRRTQKGRQQLNLWHLAGWKNRRTK